MLTTPHRALLLLLTAVVPLGACVKKAAQELGTGTAAPAPVLPPFEQEIASFKATLTLPGAWKYGYRMVERADTLYGAFRAVEFHYTADTAAGVPSRLLMVIRAFRKPAWEKLRASKKDVARLLAEHEGVVYAFSVIPSSPYPAGSASTLRVDQMMPPIVAEPTALRLTFK